MANATTLCGSVLQGRRSTVFSATMWVVLAGAALSPALAQTRTQTADSGTASVESDSARRAASFASRMTPLQDSLVLTEGRFQYYSGCRTPSARRARSRARRCALFEWDTRSLSQRTTSATLVFATPVYTVSEGVGTATIRVERQGPTGGVSSVDVETFDGSASSPADYVSVQQELRFDPGEKVKNLSLTIVDDGTVEQIETLGLRLSSPSNAGLGRLDQADVAIQDNDIEQTPTETVAAQQASRPAVASFSPDGRNESSERQFLVWQEQQGAIPKVVGQLFDSTGQPLGEKFLVSSGSGGQMAPAVSVDGRGNFAVVWRGSTGRGALAPGIFGRLFSNVGKPLTPDLTITDELLTAAVEPEVSSSNDGEVVVTWEKDGQIEGLQVGSDGTPSGASFAIALGGKKPQVSTSATGMSIVVWQQSAGPRGAAQAGIFGQLVLPGGKPIGGPLPIALSGGATNPAVATNDEGDFVVVWQQGPSGKKTVMGRLFDSTGKPKDKSFDISKGTGDQVNPRVDMNSVGDFAVTWESHGTLQEVLTGFFNRSGKKLGEPVLVASEVNGIAPTAPDVTLEDDDDVRVAFGREGARGVFSQRLDPAMTARCRKGSESLCLQEKRFEVRVSWRTSEGALGQGHTERLTNDTGYFWFFSPDNVELVVKVLDGCGINNRFWVFAGGLTNVETNIIVTDTLTGQSRSYRTARGQAFLPIQDVNALSSCQAGSAARAVGDSAASVAAAMDAAPVRGSKARRPRRRTEHRRSVDAKGTTTCTADNMTLCLNQQRFQVEVDWQTSSGTSGQGMAFPLTVDTGYFWFFNRDNVELIVKVLDGCPLNDRFWVFAGGLTNVGVTLRVTDTVSGVTQVYDNPQDQPFLPIQDTGAFAQCP